VTKLLDRFGLTNLATVQQKLADRGSRFLASQAIIIGQTTFEVIIKSLSCDAMPRAPEHQGETPR
jgi:hypothetical protein